MGSGRNSRVCALGALLLSNHAHADEPAAPEPPDAPLTPDPRLSSAETESPSASQSSTDGHLEIWILAAPSRWDLETYRRAESAYGLRAGVQLIIPFEYTALLLDTALEGTSLGDGVVVTWPVSIGYGVRLSIFELFGGGTFGALFPSNYAEGGRFVGVFASAGLNFGPARFHAEYRYNYLLSGTSKLSYVTPGLAASFRL